jgi:hypothetical protein
MDLIREKTRAVQSSSKPKRKLGWFGFMVLNATFTNISVINNICKPVIIRRQHPSTLLLADKD